MTGAGGSAYGEATAQTFEDTTTTVEAYLTEEIPSVHIYLMCRRAGLRGEPTGYRLGINPVAGTYILSRLDDGRSQRAFNWTPSPAINQGTAVNRLELTCAGGAISASVNGQHLATVEDWSYGSGSPGLFVGTPAETTAEVRFRNFTVKSA